MIDVQIRTACLAGALLASPALADHPFILPSNTAFAGDNNIATFDAAASDHVFFFDHRPLQLASIKVWKPDGTPGEPYNASQGRLRSVFDVKLDQQGTWKIVGLQTMITGSFKLNGEEHRVGSRAGPPPVAPGGGDKAMTGAARPAEGAPRRLPPVAFEDIPADGTDVHLSEMVGRVETFVTAGEPTLTVFKPVGKGLELAPITHPNSAVAGETTRFRFLIDGKPAAGLTVTVIQGGDRYRDDEGAIELTTGPDGVVPIRWPSAGRYWLGAEAQDDKPDEKRAEIRKMSYAATIEVATP